MRIIHTSDLHLGSPLTSKLPEGKRRERRSELLSNFARLTEEARRLGAAAIIIAGDLFDAVSISETARSAFLNTVSSAADIEFFCLGGNHDGALTDSLSEGLGNFHTFGAGAWQSYSLGEGVTLTGRTDCTADMFSALSLDEGEKNIVVLHGELRERSAAPETVGIRDAAGKNIDYLALGHYHTYAKHQIDKRGTAIYSGTPEGRGFDEAGECGFVLIDTARDGIRHAFVPFAGRTVRIIKLPLDGIESYPEIEARAGALLEKIPRTDIVRLELSGRYALGLWKDTEALLRSFSGRFYYFEVRDTSRLMVRPEDFVHDKSLKGEFIRLVLSDEGLTESEKERIIATGINALTGEGVEA